MEDIQSILEKINREGIEKANGEAAKIIDAAQKRANAIIEDARTRAAKTKSEGEQAAADYAERAKETLREAARDTVLKISASISTMLEQLLKQNVDKALADENAVAAIVKQAIAELTGLGEIACGAQLAATLKAQLAGNPQFTVVTDGFTGTGFTVKTDGGRVEHAFTGEVVAAELAKRLRADLAALLK